MPNTTLGESSCRAETGWHQCFAVHHLGTVLLFAEYIADAHIFLPNENSGESYEGMLGVAASVSHSWLLVRRCFSRFPYHAFSSGFSFMHSGGGHRIYVCVSGSSERITACEETGIGAGEWTSEMQSGTSATERRARTLRGFEHITKLAEVATSAAPDGDRDRKVVSLPGLLKDLHWVSGATEVGRHLLWRFVPNNRPMRSLIIIAHIYPRQCFFI